MGTRPHRLQLSRCCWLWQLVLLLQHLVLSVEFVASLLFGELDHVVLFSLAHGIMLDVEQLLQVPYIDRRCISSLVDFWPWDDDFFLRRV